MNCLKCGADNVDGAVICKNCGEKMKTESDTAYKPIKKRVKKGLFIGIAAAVIVAAIAVIFVTVVFPSVSNASLVCGNTPMNIQNGGIAAENDGWIYYCNSGDKRTLYKIRTDGTGKTKLNDDYSLFINVIGDWVYYINSSAEVSSICRVRTDGTSGEIICEEKDALQLYAYGNWIYYIAVSQGAPNLYRMRMDGTEKTAYDVMPGSFTITGGWIYYMDLSDYADQKNNKNRKMRNYKMRLDGTDKTELGEEKNTWGNNINYMTLTDGWIYCNVDFHLCKMREDGTELKKLTDDAVMEINIADGWVYYTEAKKVGIYKVRTDGTEKTNLCVNGFSLNIVGDWLYYSVKGNFYRMKTDGTENQPVE